MTWCLPLGHSLPDSYDLIPCCALLARWHGWDAPMIHGHVLLAQTIDNPCDLIDCIALLLHLLLLVSPASVEYRIASLQSASNIVTLEIIYQFWQVELVLGVTHVCLFDLHRLFAYDCLGFLNCNILGCVAFQLTFDKITFCFLFKCGWDLENFTRWRSLYRFCCLIPTLYYWIV